MCELYWKCNLTVPDKCETKEIAVISAAKIIFLTYFALHGSYNNFHLIFNLLLYNFCFHGTGSSMNTGIRSMLLTTAMSTTGSGTW